jgi:nucleotide-binding universal stress UspA family protein
LTLITVAPPVSSYVMFAGISIETLTEELGKWADHVLDAAAGTVPDGVGVHTVQASGHAGPAIVKEIERGAYDLVVLGTRGRGRAQEGLLGSVNGYVHFHSKIPLLSVPDPSPPA